MLSGTSEFRDNSRMNVHSTHRKRHFPLWLLAATLWVGVVLVQPAAAQEKWIITDFAARGVDAPTAATFHDLLRDEIQARNGATFGAVAVVCEDAECARRAGADTGASAAVQGSLNRLGQKLIVSVSVVALPSGQVTFSQRMSVDRVEELDLAAKRLAEAMVRGGTVEDSAELGTITHQEATAPTRRDTRIAALLSLQGIGPLQGYADRQFGAGFAVGVFVETYDFVIEPTVGYRFDSTTNANDFNHVPLEVALAYLFSRSDVAPLLGLGVGLHYLHEDVTVRRSIGSVLRSTSTDVITDSLVGFSVFPRIGCLFLRTYDVSLEVTLDYALTMADFQERSTEQALRLSMNLLFGGT